jgi:hypothetical protein
MVLLFCGPDNTPSSGCVREFARIVAGLLKYRVQPTHLQQSDQVR